MTVGEACFLELEDGRRFEIGVITAIASDGLTFTVRLHPAFRPSFGPDAMTLTAHPEPPDR